LTGAELARRLEVHIRTVRDYIEMLQDLGIPVEAERGRYGGYRLRPGYRLPPLIFTEDEALALTLSLLMARESGLAKADPAFEGTLAKIERVLPVSTRARIQAVEQTVVFEHRSTHPAPALGAVTALSAAVQHHQRVRLRYCSAQAKLTERTFHPYGVVAHEGVWYTIGHCELRGGQRLFRLDRILEIDVLGDTFTPPAQFDALTAVQRALAAVPRVWQVEVWVEAMLADVERQSQLSKGHFTQMHDGVLIQVEVEDLLWMARLLAGLGMPFKIQHPPELRVVFQQYVLTMLRYAEQTNDTSISQARKS
ncbi:MAG TPA: YafY family protein, partial [Ktedonobacterales bacterium]